jgi:hypothetical protein
LIILPRNSNEEQILNIVRQWVDVLAKQDYELVFSELKYAVAFDTPGAECIESEIKRYRSTNYFPGVEEFNVTDWRTAVGGNPLPLQKVIWYKPNDSKLAGAIAFDLPLNGKWSDLTADFVFSEIDHPKGYVLCLEQIDSPRQR